MTAQESLTLHVADALAASGISYLLAGSFASNYYGIPRSTKDADFVLQLAGGVGSEFAARLGDDFELDPQLSFETVTGTHRQYVRHRKTSFTIELFLLSKDAYDQERFARRREQNLFGRKVWLLSPEDVIVSKLRWARSKDEDDVRDVMAVQRGKLDWAYIESWCKRLGKFALMEEIRRSIPEI
jgi:predicted nucleotidyltransferase